MNAHFFASAIALALAAALSILAPADVSAQTASPGDTMLAEYFRAETASLAERCLADVKTLEDWTSRRAEYRRQLAEMLGLDPMPEKTDLKAVVTGKREHEFFNVENLQFQSRPGLYVTANLYLPKKQDKPAPAVLYVCGHGQVKKNGVSYGNKTTYQHHGEWLARNGFVCLTIDTIQLGEIEGIHHGTYREGMWWWNSRGYTPAGVEAWNGIRALDYLQSRPEVDGEKLGVAGRSGGGAYSWWVAALDERVKAAVPTAGITDLENHVVDGCVEGHCDCMFMVNTYRWDYPQVAALVAPRALLITNTDKDGIFPLDGVERVHRKVREIYGLYGADNQLGLQISEGPHKDIQELQVAEFHWFNRFLKGEDAPVENSGIKYLEPEELKVFETLPADEITSHIHDTFVPIAAAPQTPESKQTWSRQRDAWRQALQEKCLAGWPQSPAPLHLSEAFSEQREGLRLTVYDFESQPHVRLRLYVWNNVNLKRPSQVSLAVGDPASLPGWSKLRRNFGELLAADGLPEPVAGQEETPLAADAIQALFLPRGLGATAWDESPRKQIQNRRRFMLLGQTLAGMQAWDVRRALEAMRLIEVARGAPLQVSARGDLAAVTLYGALFGPSPEKLTLSELPVSHSSGPDLLNVMRFLDLPQVVAMVAERGPIELLTADREAWSYPAAVAQNLGWPESQLKIGSQATAEENEEGASQ
ncbi:MAG TPA: CocE/NonD family hydrolase [Pirellulales bacterium]|nr:CocE/NonD family hydrolase [Pirellulales bacterium]